MTADSFIRLVLAIGPLRLALLAIALILIVLVPAPATKAVFVGWEVIPTVVVPVLSPIVFLVLLLDALMAGVFLNDADLLGRRRLYTALIIDGAAAALLLARWLPYYAALRV